MSDTLPIYTLDEIKRRLEKEDFPFHGKTALKSAMFFFERPANWAGTAIHAGSKVRPGLVPFLGTTPEERFRDEDPHTEFFIRRFPIRLIAMDSRFEYDINREKKMAIYTGPEMAWGLNVLQKPLTDEEIHRSLNKYDEFHNLADITAGYLTRKKPFGIMFDCHSFNYQREGKTDRIKDDKPDINVGTGPVDRNYFQNFIDDFIQRLSKHRTRDNNITVNENFPFSGGYLSKRLSKIYGRNLLVLAIEFKKIFMNELTGNLFENDLYKLEEIFFQSVTDTLSATLV